MSTHMAIRWLRLLILPAALFTCSEVQAATRIWDGGGADDNWTSSVNWSNDLAVASGDDLTFGTAAAVRLNNTNDFAGGTSFGTISFASTFGYTLNGNAILLGAGGIDHLSGVGVNTVNLAGITLTAGQNWFNQANGLQTISSPINLGGFNVSVSTVGSGTSTTISGPISGSGNITKLSNGQLNLSGTNTYTGDTIAGDPGAFTSGNIRILGTNNTTIGNFIVLSGPVANGKMEFQNEGSLGGLAANVIKINPTGFGSAAEFRSLSTATLVNNVELGGISTLGLDGTTLTFNGGFTLTGNAGINWFGAVVINSGIGESGGTRSLTIGNNNRTITLAGNNTYTGPTLIGTAPVASSTTMFVRFTGTNTAATGSVTLQAGNLQVGNSLALGNSTLIFNGTAGGTFISSFGGAVTISNPIVFNAGFTFGDTLTLAGPATLNSNITISVLGGGGAMDLASNISDGGAGKSITLSFPNRTFRISGNSTFGGGLTYLVPTAVSQGGLEVGHDGALGTGTFTVSSVAGGFNKLTPVNGNRTFANAISLQNVSPLILPSGSIAFNGAATLTGNRTIQVDGTSLTFGGGVAEDTAGRTLTKTGAGTLVLGGGGSYSGVSTVSAGMLIAAGNNAMGTTAAGTTLASGTTLGFQGNINYTTAEAVGGVIGTGVGNAGAIRNLSGANSFAGPITLSGNTAFGSDAGSLTLDGAIGQTVASALNKVGPGALALAGANTYSGNTTVSNGTLLVNNGTGSGTGAGNVTVISGATLGGTGTISGTVTVNTGGTLGAGNSPGILHLGSLTFANNSTNTYELNGTVAGTGYDQLDVTGTVNLDSSAILKLMVGYTPTVFVDTYTIINNDGTDLVSGLFKEASGNVLSQEEEFAYNPSGTLGFKINYRGGTGNDVVLIAVPEPSTVALLALGGLIALRRSFRLR